MIEHRFHRNIIGQKGENIKSIRERFPEVRFFYFFKCFEFFLFVTLRCVYLDVNKDVSYRSISISLMLDQKVMLLI